MQRTNKRPMVIVAVGTDHHPFERLVEWVDAWACAHPGIEVLVQRGTSRPTAECQSVELLDHPELCAIFGSAVAVVSHGGPSTVMDARKAGKLPIVMGRNPEFGEHVDDHQMRFADHLMRHDLAMVVDDEASLHKAIDEAIANPADFTVSVETSTISGVVEFGRVLDDLLQTETPLTPESPIGAEFVDFEPVDFDARLPLDSQQDVEAGEPETSLERNSA